MDLTGYGYKRPTQEQRIAAPTVQPIAHRSSELSSEALRLLDMMPKKLQLRLLPAQFPRVLNQVAALWNRPTAAASCLQELMLDTRGTRAGFPPEVLSELLALRNYNASRIVPQKIDPWQEMHLR